VAEMDRLEELKDIAIEEAEEIAICLFKFKQKLSSCSCCNYIGFCSLLKRKGEVKP